MHFIHVPTVEILAVLSKFRNNRPFMRFSRAFFLFLVTLSAVSYAGEWVKALDADFPACVIGKWICYQGPPLSLTEFVFQLGAPVILFLLPVIDVIVALLLLLKPSRTYLAAFLLSLVSIFVHLLSDPTPYVYSKTGNGSWLHLFAMTLLFFLSLPLALNEQMELYPHWDYKKILPGYMQD